MNDYRKVVISRCPKNRYGRKRKRGRENFYRISWSTDPAWDPQRPWSPKVSDIIMSGQAGICFVYGATKATIAEFKAYRAIDNACAHTKGHVTRVVQNFQYQPQPGELI